MSTSLQKLRINLVGGIPSPVGGVTTHVYTLALALEELGLLNIVYDLYDSSQKYSFSSNSIIMLRGNSIIKVLKMVYYLNRTKNEIFHFHISGGVRFAIISPLFLWASRKNYNVLTIHDGDPFRWYSQMNKLYKFFFHKALNKFNLFFVLSPRIESFIKKNVDSPKYINTTSYIKSKEFSYQVEHSSNEEFRIISSGYLTSIYNFPELINCISDIRKILKKEIKLVMCIYGDIEKDIEEKVNKLLDKVTFVEVFRNLNREEFLKKLKNSNLLVRPTSYDSFGLVVAESISMGVPAIASSVCERYPGTILYSKDNFDELKQKVVDVIQNYNIHKENTLRVLNNKCALEDHLKGYKSLLKNDLIK